MKALKKWLREWLQVEEETRLFIQRQRQLNDSMSMRASNMDGYADLLRAQMNDAAASVQRQAKEQQHIIQQRALKPLWRRYGAEHVGADYGRIASDAAMADYPAHPTHIAVSMMRLALPEAQVLHHLTRGFVAIQHIPLHPHHKRPVIDFGDTEEQALLNLSQQLVQVALHEGWTIIDKEN